MKINIIIAHQKKDCIPCIASCPPLNGVDVVFNDYSSGKIYDCIFVVDELRKPLDVICNKENIFFGTAEVPYVINYRDKTQFLSQFAKIFSCHAIYNHPNVFTELPFVPFLDPSHCKYTQYTFEEIYNGNSHKTKILSIISSAKQYTEFHNIRYDFSCALKEHFKDKIDFYGSGHNAFESKAIAIEPYKYHIVIENQITPNVITEKLWDAYLGNCFPIYCGATNVEEYHSTKSMKQINIFNFKQSVQTIEEIIDGNTYEKSLDAIIEEKHNILEKYHYIYRKVEICKKHYQDLPKQRMILQPFNHVQPKKANRLPKLKNSIKKRLIKVANKL